MKNNQKNSIKHALHFLKQYKKKYGFSKFVRVGFHYVFILIKKMFPEASDKIIKVNGYEMKTIPNDSGISQELKTFKIHEPISTKLISNYLKKDMICLDIGANIGYFALLERKIVGDMGKVIAIEPVPNNFRYLQENIRLQNLENILTYNFAVGDIEGSTRFFVNERSNGSKILLENEDLPNRPGYVMNVPIKKIDDFLLEIKLKKIDFVRMDVEGYELNIFHGMEKTIQNSNPIIQLEVHKGRMGEDRMRKFFEFFLKYGYHCALYHERDLDLRFIGKMTDVKEFSIKELLMMLENKLLPNYFNLLLKPTKWGKNDTT